MADVMGNLSLFEESANRIVYVSSWRMIEYVKSEKRLRVIGTHENVERLETEYGISFYDPNSKPDETKTEENDFGFLGKIHRFLFQR